MGCACFKSEVVIKSSRSHLNFNHINDVQPLNNPLSQNVVNNHRAVSDIRHHSISYYNNHNNIGNRNDRNFGNRASSLQKILSQENEFMPPLQMNEIQDFNMQELEDIYVGIGFKRMKAYICRINQEELEKKREAFWGTRVQGDSTSWELLRYLCQTKELDEETIKSTMHDTLLRPLKDCINVVYDSKGYLYEIPNYCINDPYKYEIDEEKKTNLVPEEKIINILIKKGANKLELQVSNLVRIKDLKEIVAQSNIYIEDINKVRLFFGGKELKNDKQVYFYNIEESNIIQML